MGADAAPECLAPAETSLQVQYIVPMTISPGFGIVFATAVILLLVPCLCPILEDLNGLMRRLTADEEEQREAPKGPRAATGAATPSID